LNESTVSPLAVTCSWQNGYISKMTYKPSKPGQAGVGSRPKGKYGSCVGGRWSPC